jgi:DNA-binding transcriptional regulator YhcF (GntR family)
MTTSTAETRKLYQQVANAIADSIRDGAFQPGQRLPSERDLAEDYKVSRPTVREAMIALEIRGLVEARHGSGVYVTEAPPVEVTAPELDIGAFELTEARRLIEGESPRLAATTITDQELIDLEKILDDMVEENDTRRARRPGRPPVPRHHRPRHPQQRPGHRDREPVGPALQVAPVPGDAGARPPGGRAAADRRPPGNPQRPEGPRPQAPATPCASTWAG